MRIMIETTAPLSETDHKILALLLDRHESTAPAPAAKPAEAPKAATKKPEPTEAPEPAAEPEEVAPEPAETDQDSPATDEEMDAAVSAAKKLVQDGKKAAVRKALEAAGVARVGAIETSGQATRFLAALEG